MEVLLYLDSCMCGEHASTLLQDDQSRLGQLDLSYLYTDYFNYRILTKY